jgi:class 3 adenylate cyclase
MDRRLAAILSYDAVGYTLAMGRDEAGTLDALKSHRQEIIEPKANQHGGRTVKLMGDGALMEFASVVRRRHLRGRHAMRHGRAQRGAARGAAPPLSYRHQCW